MNCANRFLGTVYGVLLNDARSLERRRSAFLQAPYHHPPVAPVLYIKPRNTFTDDGALVLIPDDPGTVQIGATIGAVIGARARQLTPRTALQSVRGYVIVSDVTLLHQDLFRPAIRQRCRDGFCPMSAEIVPEAEFDVCHAAIEVSINQEPVAQGDFSSMVRDIVGLLCEVTEFMTLEANDVLLLGLFEEAALAKAGDEVLIDVPGLGRLQHRIGREAARQRA